MDFITPACPPTPTLDELLKSGNFIEVNVKHLVPGEIVVLMEQVAMNPDTKKIHCVNILNNSNGYIEYIYIGPKYRSGKADFSIGEPYKNLYRYGYKFYKKKNPRKDFDDMVNEIRSYPEGKKLTRMQSVLTNPGISERVGEYLGGPSSLRNPFKNPNEKGGRRKRAGTRRKTRKNKRKSTRRIRRK